MSRAMSIEVLRKVLRETNDDYALAPERAKDNFLTCILPLMRICYAPYVGRG